MRKVVLCSVVAACLAAVPAGVAQGATDDPSDLPAGIADLPVAQANPDVDLGVIALLPEVVQNSTVTIDEDFIPGSPIVYPDGTPVEGQGPDTQARAALAVAACGGTATATGLLGIWGNESVCGVAVFGSPGYVRSYSWWTSSSIATSKGCAQGRGFDKMGARTWYGLGTCGNSYYNYGVPWGNVLSNPAVRVKSNNPPAGITVGWSS